METSNWRRIPSVNQIQSLYHWFAASGLTKTRTALPKQDMVEAVALRIEQGSSSKPRGSLIPKD